MYGQQTATVLCVDDEPDGRLSTAMLLRAEGYNVREAGTGAEALTMAGDADLVILDVCLPDLDGFEVSRRVKADPITALIPVVLLSGVFTRTENKVEGFDCGGDAYLTKPVEPRELLGQIKALLRVRRAEEALVMRDRAIRAASEGIVITDPTQPDNPITYASPGYERVTGYQIKEVVGRNCRFLQGPGSDPEAISRMRAAVQAGEHCTEEVLNYRKDGTPFWNAVSISPVRDTAGRLTHFVGVQADVTDRKKAEEALRASEERYRHVIESNIAAIFFWNLSGSINDANDAFLQIMGYTRDDLNAGLLNWQSMTPQEYLSLDTLAMKQLTTTGRCEPYEKELIRKDGSRTPVVIAAAKLAGCSDDGVAFALDITERLRAEAAQRESELRYRLVAQAAHDAIWDWDLITDQVLWNEGIHHRFGYALDFMNSDLAWWVDRIHTDDRQRIVDGIHKVIDGTEELWQDEYQFKRADGTFATVADCGRVLRDETGRAIRMVGSLLDLTERKQAEAALKQVEEQFRQAQKMEAVGRLAGGVAHDFNNLLTVITGYSELLLGRFPVDNPIRDLVVEIKGAGDRAAELTSQLLAFSRQTVLEPKLLDPNTLIRRSERMLRRIIGEDVDLVTHLAPDIGWVKVDPSQLEHSVMNLAINARDAMPHGGKLTIETRYVELNETATPIHPELRPGHYIRLSVVDTGHGMDEDTLARVFDPFFTTKEVGKGTGLGLAMVFGFVKQSGGHIVVESKPGRGATFTMYLPRADGVAMDPHPAPISVAPVVRGSETVLIVEDEDGVRALTKYVLRRAGYTVLEAAHGLDALKVVREHSGPIHLLITDVVMPGMSGRQLADMIRQNRQELRVLYVSGYTADAVVRRGVLEAESHFLQKPFSPGTLSEKVRDILDGAP